MIRYKVLMLSILSVFVLAGTGDTMTKPEKCVQESSGFRGGYSNSKVYLCEVDVKRLWLVDQNGYRQPAPTGVYKIGNGQDAREIDVGKGFLLK